MAQSFLFSDTVVVKPNSIPSYESLVGLWRLGHKLEIDGLCDRSLLAMTECRQITQRIPATPLLVQVWKDAPEGSTIRTLLLSWAAEYMRWSDARADFAKSLPQEVLSELVVTMSAFDNLPLVTGRHQSCPAPPADLARKNVHYLEEDSSEETLMANKRNRISGTILSPLDASRRNLSNPLPKPQKRRSNGHHVDGRSFTTAQKLNFCADLLSRMLSGPGKQLAWARCDSPRMVLLTRPAQDSGRGW